MFHDQGFVDLQRNLIPFRNRGQHSFEILSIHLDIRKHGSGRTSCQSLLHEEHFPGFFFERKCLSGSQDVRGTIDLSAIHQDVSVNNQLSCGQKSGSKPKAINDIVQSAFKKTDECFARDSRFLKASFT